MAPPVKPPIPKRKRENLLQQFYNKYVNFAFVKYLIFDPAALPIVTVLILLAELVINIIVIQRVPYTEIDWIAYMQECEGFLNGTTNYALLRGDTGPLVYPAAFVYIYSAFYFITSHGQNVRVAQYIFAGIYLLQMWLVLRLYAKSRKVPPFVLVLSAFTSYRIHSIYVLRLFNDPVAILFLYAALNLFMDGRWSLGSVFFSLGVGVKMNILLFAPALLIFYIVNLGYLQTVKQLFICGVLQLLLGAPFLLTYPVEYLKGSFDLGRVFEHKWTVNFRFLPRDIFENKYFHLGLLGVHVLLLVVFAVPMFRFFRNYVRLRELQKQFMPQIKRHNEQAERMQKQKKKIPVATKKEEENLTKEELSFLQSFEKGLQNSTGLKSPQNVSTSTSSAPDNQDSKVNIHFDQCTQLALLPFFVCNFLGLVCARSLHYQFYVWYFHSLPYLTWSTDYSLGLRFLLLGLIEYAWNTYPSTNYSSGILHLSHLVLLVGLGRYMYKTTKFGAAMRNATVTTKQASQATTANSSKAGTKHKKQY